MTCTDQQLLKVQKISTAILGEVVAICERHGIGYYLVGGTELGAVRHKGFIPWDDDVDMLMTFDEHGRFIKAARAELPEHLAVDKAFSADRQNPYCPDVTQVYDKRYRMIDVSAHPMNLSVEIHVLVGMPQNRIACECYYRELLFLKALTRVSRPEIIGNNYWQNRNCIRQQIIRVVQKARFDKLLDHHNRLRALERALRRYPIEEAEFAMLYPSPYGKKEIVPKSYYGDGVEGEFEGIRVQLPSRYHELLTRIYGDYMTPPTEPSERTTHAVQLEELKEDGSWGACSDQGA